MIEGVPYMRYDYCIGSKGLGGWTQKADSDGWYYSFFCKAIGTGARKGFGMNFKYVPRLTSKRRSRKACEDRSYNLAYGKPITAGIKVKKPGKNPPNTGFCMKEKKHVIVERWFEITLTNGRTMLQGDCPECGTKIQKYGRLLPLCPECELPYREVSANDYICKACRAAQSLEQPDQEDDE